VTLQRHTAAYFLARALPALLAIPALAIFTRLLSPHEFGVYIIAMTTIGLSQSMFFTWIGVTALRLLPQANDKPSFYSSLLICYAAVTLLAAAAGCVAVLAGFGAALVAVTVATFALMSAFDLQLFVLRALLHSTSYLWISIARAVFTVLLGVAAAYFGTGALGLISSNGVASVVSLLLMVAFSALPLLPQKARRDDMRQVLGYGLPLAGGFIAEAVTVNVDRLLLASFRGSAEAGIYGSAYGIASRLITAATEPVGTAGFSLAIHKFETEGAAAASEQLKRNTAFLLFIGVPTAVGLMLVAPDLVDLLLGEDFRSGALAVIPPLALAGLLIAVRQQYCEACFHLARRTRLYATVSTLNMIVSVVGCAVGVWKFGATGTAYALALTQFYSVLSTAYVGNRIFPAGFPWTDAAKILVATVAMALAVQVVPAGNGIVSLVGQAAAGAVVYSFMTIVLDIAQVKGALLQFIRGYIGRGPK